MGLLAGIGGSLLTACDGKNTRSRAGKEVTKTVKSIEELQFNDNKLMQLMGNPEERRVQVLFSIVEQDQHRKRYLKRSAYRLGSEYFYPASAVKLLAAAMVFEAIAQLNNNYGIELVTVDTPLYILPLFAGDDIDRGDPDDVKGETTLRRELTKLFVASDNRAFNRLYDICGSDLLNAGARQMGLTSTVLTHRLSDPRRVPIQSDTAGVVFLTAHGNISIPHRSATGTPGSNYGRGLQVGNAVATSEGVIAGPMDFTHRNGISLLDLQNLLVSIAAPDIPIPVSLPASIRVATPMLTELGAMYPRDSGVKEYAGAEYTDSYVKLFLPGLCRIAPQREWRVCNKVGQAYGFTTENAWITHLPTGRECFLAATVYTNCDGVLNDDRYEYNSVAEPFMAELARVLLT